MAQMMAIAAVFQAVVSAVEAYTATIDERKIRGEQKKLSELNIKATRAENLENERRLANTQSQQEGTARATAAALGVESESGSIAASLTAMETENKLQLNWLKSAGISKVTAQQQQSLIAMQQSKSREKAGYFGTVGAIAEGVGAVSSAGTDAGWWNNTPRTATTTGVLF